VFTVSIGGSSTGSAVVTNISTGGSSCILLIGEGRTFDSNKVQNMRLCICMKGSDSNESIFILL
jgi:hypothetical protein